MIFRAAWNGLERMNVDSCLLKTYLGLDDDLGDADSVGRRRHGVKRSQLAQKSDVIESQWERVAFLIESKVKQL
jgi:hypothetical protein